MYPEHLVAPMRKELVDAGFIELRSSRDVAETLTNSKGSLLIAINSVCGCSAGVFRPGVIASLQSAKKPGSLTTVFAGQDKEATESARSYFLGYPPSSPSAAIFKDGQIVYMLERKDVEGHSAKEVETKLRQAYEQYC